MNRAPDLLQLTDEFLMLLHESAEFQNDDRVRSALCAAQSWVCRLRRRVQLAVRKYVVAVVGLTNVGKSTLLNALLHAEITPRRNGPCTAVPIEFKAGSRWGVQVEYQGELQRAQYLCADADEVRRLIDRFGRVIPGRERPIHKVVIRLSHPLLNHGLVIADTPGFGAAQAGEAEGTHDAAVREYLTHEVAQVLWVVLAEQGIGKRELDFHDAYFADLCDDIVVTGCEDWSDRDAQRFRSRFGQLFTHRWPTLHFVSGVERTGIPELQARIHDLAEPAGRFRSVITSFIALAMDLRHWLNDHRLSTGAGTTVWRPDSWLRFADAPDCGGLRDRLTRILR